MLPSFNERRIAVSERSDRLFVFLFEVLAVLLDTMIFNLAFAEEIKKRLDVSLEANRYTLLLPALYHGRPSASSTVKSENTFGYLTQQIAATFPNTSRISSSADGCVRISITHRSARRLADQPIVVASPIGAMRLIAEVTIFLNANATPELSRTKSSDILR